jgi:hypothetical protein
VTARDNGEAARRPPCQLTGTDGNVFAVIANVRRALKDQPERAAEFAARAFASRSYEVVLQLCFEYVEVE